MRLIFQRFAVPLSRPVRPAVAQERASHRREDDSARVKGFRTALTMRVVCLLRLSLKRLCTLATTKSNRARVIWCWQVSGGSEFSAVASLELDTSVIEARPVVV